MGMRFTLSILAFLADVVRTQLQLEYNITTTWNGGKIDHDPIQLVLSGRPGEGYLELGIKAPFFNDPPAPPGPAGQPFFGLWNYEVVEAFFLNDDDQYVEVEVCPWGQHIVLLLNGQRTTIRHSLPLEVNTSITGASWTGSARIPVGYLPRNVTKFNAYGIHGSEKNRVYESLYPAPEHSTAPDFHALQYFSEIDLSEILADEEISELSELWSDSLKGIFRYKIQTTWDGTPIEHAPAEITLQGFTAGVEMNVSAPFFNDPAPPNGKPGAPYYGLWDYEVVEMFFLNNNNEYLEVELGPWGEHLLLMLKGPRDAVKHSLPLDYFAERDETTGTWKGSAMIPPEYFPPKVNRINAYAINGVDDKREYQSLYPAPHDDPLYPAPDFHRLELFQPIDFEFQLANNSEYSDLWRGAINSGSESFTTVIEEGNDEENIESVTVLGPAEAVLQTTSSPSQAPPDEKSPVLTSHQHAFATVKQSESLFSIEEAPAIKQVPPSRIPKPQLIVPEMRKEREDEPPALFTSGHEPQTPHPIRIGNRRISPSQRPAFVRQPSGTFAGLRSQGVSQSERGVPERTRFHNQRPILQNVNLKPITQIRQPVSSSGNLHHRPAQSPVIHSPVQHEHFSHNERSGHPPFLDQQLGQTQLFNDEQPLVVVPNRAHFQNRDQQQFQNQGEGQFKDHRESHLQNPIPHTPQEDIQPQFFNQGDSRIHIDERIPIHEESQPHVVNPNAETTKPEEFNPTELSGLEPQDQDFQTHQSVPGTVPGVTQPLQTAGLEETITPEVEGILLTLSEEVPALPPPHPICFELGLVPDPDRCYVFHECVLEEGHWEMYSWRCKRGQIFDPVNVACVRGRCARRRQTKRRRVRGPSY